MSSRKRNGRQGDQFVAPSVGWSAAYEDEVAAAKAGVLFQPGCVPQKGKCLEHVIDLDAPDGPGPGSWLTGEAWDPSGGPAGRRGKGR